MATLHKCHGEGGEKKGKALQGLPPDCRPSLSVSAGIERDYHTQITVQWVGVYLKKGTGGCNLSLPHKCPNRHVLRSLSNNCWVNKEQQIEGEARERTSHRYTTTHNRTRTRRLSASWGRFWVTSVRAMDGEEERRRGRKSAFVFTWAWSVEIRWLSHNTCCRDNAMPLRHCCRLKTLRESRRWVRAYSRQSCHFQEV